MISGSHNSRDFGQVPVAVTLALGAVSGKNHLLPFVIW